MSNSARDKQTGSYGKYFGQCSNSF